MVAKTICIEEHLGLVYLCAKKFIKRGLEYDDIVQAGFLGLTKASKSFIKEKGVKFSTYAVYFILGEIKELFRKSNPVKVSRSIKDLSLKISRETEQFLLEKRRNPSVEELASILNKSKEDILEALESAQKPLSIDTYYSSEESCNKFESVDISVDFDEEEISSRISLSNALKTLNKTDKTLIILRFFKGKTQEETGKLMGISQVKVSRREKIILKNLRMKMT